MGIKKEGYYQSKNNDKECFKWTMIAALHHGDIVKGNNITTKTVIL